MTDPTAAAACPGDAPPSENEISPADLAKRIAAGAADLVDVRTGAEYRAVRVRGTRHAPLDALDPDAVKAGRPATVQGPIYLLCKGGSRARMAAGKLRAAGIACVVVTGGTDACVAAGIPVERDATSRVWPIERQVRLIAGLLVLIGVSTGWFIHPLGYGLAAFVGLGLAFAGATDICGMALVLGRCPWNR
jgi:rhodanese-related sulfurtransferase